MAEIATGIEIRGLALWIPNEKALIIADPHIGFEESLNKEGVFVPRLQYKTLEKRLAGILATLKPSIVIINGDLKDEFGTISEQEWREVMGVLSLIEKYCRNIILVKGNHDTILGPIAKIRNIKFVNYFVLGDCYIVHGDAMPMDSFYKKAKNVIIGHEHPAVTLREGPKSEKFKCFLKGNYNGKTLIVMPSFNFVIEGSDLLSENRLSPFLQQSLDDFRVFIVSEKTAYDFGSLGDLRCI